MLPDTGDERPETKDGRSGTREDVTARLAAKLARRERLAEADIDSLMQSDLLSLGMLADDVRRSRHGNRVTFVRVAEFAAAPSLALPATLPEAAREVRVSGRPASLADAFARVRALSEIAGGRPVTGFTLNDIDDLCRSHAQSLSAVLVKLREAGLAEIAEISVERTASPVALLQGLEASDLWVGRASIRHAADARSAIDLIRVVQGWGPLARRIRAFAPVPRDLTPGSPATGYDEVRQIALARLLVDGIERIQMEWTLHGPKLAQVGLTFGTDDLDAVSPLDTTELGLRRSVLEEVRRNITSAGLVSVERDGLYRTVAS